MADILLSVGVDKRSIRKSDFTNAVKDVLATVSPKSMPKVGIGIKVADGAIKEFRSQLQTIVNAITLDSGSLIKIDVGQMGVVTSQIKQTESAVRSLKSTVDSTKGSQILSGADLDMAVAKIKKVENALLALQKKNATTGNEDIEARIEAQLAAVAEIRRTLESTGGMTNSAFADAFKTARAGLLNLSEDMKSLGMQSQDWGSKMVRNTKEYSDGLRTAVDLVQKLKDAQKNWTAAKNGVSSKEYGELAGLQKEAQYIVDNYDQLTRGQILGGIASISSRFDENASAIRNAGEACSGFLSKLKGIPGAVAKLFGAQRIFSMLYRSMRSAIETVIELDGAMTQLQIVTGATDSEMTRFMTSATQLAKDLGKSISDIAGSIEVFSRLGYNLTDASQLTKYATIMSNVAAVSTDEATTGLTSIIKGYNMDVDNAEHVADVLVEVGQKYAVSAGELMAAFERSGAALAASNTNFEKSAGIIAAANAAVQNANTVGTALKTVSARIRGSKTDLAELGEDTEEFAEGFSKYADEIKALTHFDIRMEGTTDTYKDLYDIFAGIAEVWDQLSDTQQARVSEILGGTRQLQVISSILANWDDSVNAYTDAMNSAGTATEANDRYMESIKGHIGELKATWQEFASSTFTREAITQVIDLGTAILDGPLTAIGELISKLGVLKTAIIGLGIIGYVKQSGGLTSVLSGFLEMLTTAPRKFTALRSIGMDTFQSLSGAIFGSTGALKQFVIAAAAIGAVVGIVHLIKSSFDTYTESVDRAKDSLNDYNDQKQSVESLRKELETMGSRMDELRAKGALTITEEAELTRLQGESKELETQLKLEEAILEAKARQAYIDAQAAASNKGFRVNDKGEIEELSEWDKFWEGGRTDYDYVTGESHESGFLTLTELVETETKKLSDLTAQYNAKVAEAAAAAMDPSVTDAELEQMKADADELQQQITDIQLASSQYVQDLSSYITTYQFAGETEAAAALQEIVDGWLEAAGELDRAQRDAAERQQRIDDVLSKDEYSSAINTVQELARAEDGLSVDKVLELARAFPLLGQAIKEACGDAVTDLDNLTTEEARKAVEDFVQQLNASADIVNESAIRSKFAEQFDPSNYASWSAAENARRTELAAWDEFWETLTYDQKRALASLDVSKLSIPEIKEYLDSLGDTVLLDDAVNSFTAYKNGLESIQSIMESGEPVSYEDLQATGVSAYADALEEVNGQYQYNKQAVLEIAAARRDEQMQALEGLRQEQEAQKEQLETNIALKEAEAERYGMTTSLGQAAQAEANAYAAGLTEVEGKIREIDILMSSVNDTYNNFAKQDLSLNTISDSVSAFADGLSAVQQSLSSGEPVTLDMFNSDELKDYAGALEMVNGQYVYNAELVREITEAKREELKAEIATRKALKKAEYDKVSDDIEEMQKLLDDATDSMDDLERQAKQSELREALDHRDAIENDIQGLNILSSQLDNTFSKYQEWLNMKNAPSSGEMFDEVTEAFQLVYDTLYNGGSEVYKKIGNPDYQSALNLLLPDKNMTQAQIDEWFQSFSDYWIKDADGNFTNRLNLQKFQDELIDNGYLQIDEKTGELAITTGTSLSEIADSLGMTKDAVWSFFQYWNQYLDDAHKFDIGDEFMPSVEELGDNVTRAINDLQALGVLDDTLNLKVDLEGYDTVEDKVAAIDDQVSQLKDILVTYDSDDPSYAVIQGAIHDLLLMKHQLENPTTVALDTSGLTEDTSNIYQALYDIQQAREQIAALEQLQSENPEVSFDADIQSLNDKIAEAQGILEGYENTPAMAELGIDPKSLEDIEGLIDGAIGHEDNPYQVYVQAHLVNAEGEDGVVDETEDGQQTIEVVATLNRDEIDTFMEEELPHKELPVDAKLGAESVSGLQGELDAQLAANGGLSAEVSVTPDDAGSGIQDEEPTVTYVVIDDEVDAFLAKKIDRTASVTYKCYHSDVDKFLKTLGNKSYTVTYTVKTIGSTPQSGTTSLGGASKQHAVLGTAYARGTWGTTEAGEYLVGELGRELVVNPRTGKWYTVGNQGAEFASLPKGAIVFNHIQTEDLLKDGKILSRAFGVYNSHAQALGNAFITGSVGGFDINDYMKWATGGYSSGGSYSTSSSSTRNTGSKKASGEADNWFEREYAYHNHLINMEQEDVEDYLKWLDEAYKKAYNEKLIELEDTYEYEEEIFEKLRELYQDSLDDVEHTIEMLQHYRGTAPQVIAYYKSMMGSIQTEINAARKAGLDDNDEYIQELQDRWWEYHDAIVDIEDETIDDAEDALDELVRFRMDMLKQDLENEKDNLDDRLDALKDFYDKQKEMLQDQFDEEDYLEEQREKRKSVSDLEAQLAQLELDDSAWASKRKIELREQLAEARGDLDDFERDHAREMMEDELDKQYELQAGALEDELDLLEAKLDNERALYDQALNDIRNHSQELMDEMIEWNAQYGSFIDRDVVQMWKAAEEALQNYKALYDDFYLGVDMGSPSTPSSSFAPDQGNTWADNPISEDYYKNKQPAPTPSGGSSSSSGSSGSSTQKTIAVGSKIRADGALIYASPSGGKGQKQYFASDPVYVVIGESGSRYLVRYHRLSKGQTGYFNKSDVKAYAHGTPWALPGIAKIDELGPEYTFASSDGNKYRVFSGGEKVLNAQATDFLYKFANSGGGVVKDMMASILSKIAPTISSVQSQPGDIVMGDIIIQGNANEKTVSEIRRAQRDDVNYILKKFKRLNV